MTATVYRLADYRPTGALSVPCPYCRAPRGSRCVYLRSMQIRAAHPDRVATAEAHLERNHRA